MRAFKDKEPRTMQILLTILMLIAASVTTSAPPRRVAVTIDDMPFLSGKAYWTPEQESDGFRSVMSALKKHNVKVIGFVNGSRIKEHHRVLFDEFIAAGHVIGNHTSTHPDFNTTAVESYRKDIADGQEQIASWVGKTKYFRYPMLHEGPTEAKRRPIKEYLRKNHLISVQVTIDNDDWLYNRDYCQALKAKREQQADSIGAAYLAHMRERTAYFDSVSVAKLGRSVDHILLLHMTQLNADYLDSLLTWYASQGWQFISPEEAITDSVYNMPQRYLGTNGISVLLRI